MTSSPSPGDGVNTSIASLPVQFSSTSPQAESQVESQIQESTAELKQINKQLRCEIAYRKQVEHALRESEAKYRELVENANSIILRLDIQGSITFFNEFAQTFFGYSEAEILGCSANGSIIPETETSGRNLTTLIQDIVQQPEQYRYHENENIRRDGSRVWVAWTNKAIFDPRGKVSGILCIGNDITERYLTQAALEVANEELEHRVAERTAALTQANEQLRQEIAERQRGREKEQQLIASLQAAKGQMQAVLDAVPGCVSWIRSDLKYEGVNRYLAEMFQLSPEDFIGEELGFRNSAAGFKAFITQFFASPEREASIELETPVNGISRHYLLVAQKYLQGGAAVCVGVDITELKRTEEALRFSEEKFAKAFRCCPNSMTISTLAEGRYLEVNETLLQYLGYEREEVIGRTVEELNIWVHPEDRDRMVQHLQQHGAIDNEEFEFRTKSGEIRVGLLSAEIITLGDEPCLLALSNNITERKRAEAQLRDAAQRDSLLAEIAARIRQSLDLDEILNTTVQEVRQFLQADRVAIAYMDGEMQGKVIAESVDSQWRSCLGLTVKGDSYLQELNSLFEQTDAQIIEDIRLVEDKTPERAEFLKQFQIKAALGVSIVVDDQMYGMLVAHQCSSPRRWQPLEVELLRSLATQVAIAIKQGRLYQQLSVLNASLECQVEERTAQLQQKMQELQEINQLKDVFLHAVSHDLRTPVMGMLMVLKNLLNTSLPSVSDSLSNPGQRTILVPRSILERMVQSSDRQLNLINSLLEVHASERHGISCQLEPLSLGQFVRDVVAEVEPLLRKNQVTLENLVPEDLPLVRADAAQLWRVFENLIANAMKHNPPGINLTISTKVEGGKVRCAIADNGVGMEQAQCDPLFELYYRGASARQLSGVGLGLYLCRQILAAHGGKIGAISSPGSGTTFWFTLPLHQT
ncbi:MULTISPECIES: PAS domain S-box protein [unclassified Coleofasciculus]|uniref:PAS domain S-box protein n=1 Tax=unclassified Coleofasciculus TaxID=2692782 RepID=UPI00187F6856|nr:MULTISPECIES: PAS domain S-box protein [unclassified Coleofasciculus]MBE9127785.1 PAS domain S-box protein [Coleofasciculus sp. LEGE 07081]MBE9148580.1 PAS domain S-box protein [Coleofasciculus sp. LEGE 07092]